MIHRFMPWKPSPWHVGIALAGLLTVIAALCWESQWITTEAAPETSHQAGKVAVNPGENGPKIPSLSNQSSMESPRVNPMDIRTGFPIPWNFPANTGSQDGLDGGGGRERDAVPDRREEMQNAAGQSVRMPAGTPMTDAVVGGFHSQFDATSSAKHASGYPVVGKISSGLPSVATPGVLVTVPSSSHLSPNLQSAQASVGGGDGATVPPSAPDRGSPDRLTPASSVANPTTSVASGSGSMQVGYVQQGQQSSPGVESLTSGDRMVREPTAEDWYRVQYGWAAYGEMIRQRMINQASREPSPNAGVDATGSLPSSSRQ